MNRKLRIINLNETTNITISNTFNSCFSVILGSFCVFQVVFFLKGKYSLTFLIKLTFEHVDTISCSTEIFIKSEFLTKKKSFSLSWFY